MWKRFEIVGRRGLPLASTLLIAAACGHSNHQVHAADAAPSAIVNQVAIDNFTFTPRELTVKAGTRVTWVNHDDVPHTATSSNTPRVFDSRTLDTDQSFSFVFDKPGEYPYFCAVHRHMTGKIVVQ